VVSKELEEIPHQDAIVAPGPGKLIGIQEAGVDPADHGSIVDSAEGGDVAGCQVFFSLFPGHMWPPCQFSF